MITIADIDAAPEAVLRSWFSDFTRPATPEAEALMERLCLRVEGLGMVDADGKLVDKGGAKG